MASRGQPKISLFPFMSVLACTIGAMMMLLVAMSLAAVGASQSSTRAGVTTQKRLDSDRRELEHEQRQLDLAEALWAEVDESLGRHGLGLGLSSSSIERALEGERRRHEIEETLDDLEEESLLLAAERNTIETTIAVLESRRETLPILIDSTGLSRRLEPFFIECDRGGATAYRATDDFRYFIPRGNLSTSGDLGRYLRRARAYPGALLVLLVRPNGIGTMARVQEIAIAAGIRVARLPLPGKGDLDWSLLRRAEGGEG